MDLNRHTSSDESGGNFSAELSYHMRSSISFVGETRLSDFCLENFGFGRKSESLVSPEEMLGRMWKLSSALKFPPDSSLGVCRFKPMGGRI